MSYAEESRILAADSASVDAFFRLRVSNPIPLFDSKLTVDNQPLQWDDSQTSGSGTTSTYNTNQASNTMAVASSTAGTRVRQTKRRFNYQAGKSQLIEMTFVLGTGGTGITKRVGMFDGQNGLFLEQSGTTLQLVRRTYVTGSAVDTAVTQANWNVDKLNGTGKSAVTLDVTKTQIFFIDFQWLGVGRVRFGFVIDGVPIVCHQILNANVLDKVYISTPNLPLRYEITNSGAGSANSIVQICSAVSSEGGTPVVGAPFSILRWTQFSTNAANTYFPLMAVRLKSTHLGAAVTIRNISVMCTSTSEYAIVGVLNPTVTGTAFSYTSLTNSAIEYDISTTNATTISGGTQIWAHVEQSSASNNITDVFSNPVEIGLGSTIAGVSDVLVVGVIVPAAPAETFRAAITWLEVF